MDELANDEKLGKNEKKKEASKWRTRISRLADFLV